MKVLNDTWKFQSLQFNNDLNDALQQQHHAAQFIAMVGKYLLLQKDDDSNTNMAFISKKGMLIGNILPNGMRVALQLSEMKICILDKYGDTKKIIQLEGNLKQRVFDELAQNLADLGIDVTSLVNEMHYDIPSHLLDRSGIFKVENKNSFIENANYRHNAKVVLNEVAQLFKQDEAIRIWPHHFDSGAFFVVEKNDKGEPTKTIGIGFAIPDSMVNEPYYYLSFWSDKPIKGIEEITASDNGKWMMPDWNGAVLRHSEIIKINNAEEQHELVLDFFTSGINILMNLLNV